jgi:hypothetical protein
MTGRSGVRPKCEPDCTCGHHPIEKLTNQQCYDRAAPLGPEDYRILARTFGFYDAWEAQQFAARQQRKAEGFIAVADEAIR